MKKITTIMAFAAFCMLFAGCVREEIHDSDMDINFGAKAPVSMITKTAYSYHQETIESKLWERIDWENGDMIRILCDQVSSDPKYFDYDLTLTENDGIKSFATADPHGAEHGLQWGSGTHTFFSLYPSPSTTGAESGIGLELTGGSTARATGVLPANQSAASRTVTLEDSSTATYFGNMNLAYMTAAEQAAEGSDVTLSFKPMVTTFFVTVVNTTGSPMTLRKVELSSSSTALTGTYRISMTKDNARPGSYEYRVGGDWESSVSRTDSNSSIYAEFSNTQLTANQSITVALFALPKEITNLTLTVTADETGPVSLPLKYNDAFITFAGEKKHNINNINVPSVSYTLDVNPSPIVYDYLGAYDTVTDAQEFTVTSYKTIGSNIRDTPWQTEIWIDADDDGIQDANEWSVLADVISNPEYSWLDQFPTSSESTVDADDDSSTTTHTFRKRVSEQDVVSHEDMLKSGKVYDTDGTTPLTHNSPATAIDLSYYDFVNRKLETTRYTANTYIISSPGYYKIPLVYGNGIENGSTVADSYTGRAARLGHLDYFNCPYPNSGGTESSIHLVSTRPWLNDRRSSSVRAHWEKYSYWDETAQEELVTQKRHNEGSLNITSPIDNLSITTGTGNERFLVFEVTEANIHPGNVLLASLDSYGNVQWSWQIWITDQDMHPVNINNGTRSYAIMPVNLGWTDKSKGLHYEPREAVLRFASTEKAGLYSAHTLTVQQTGEDLTSTTGWSTFYQWGRKDPMTDEVSKGSNNDGYLHESVKHPNDMFYDKSSKWGERYYDWTIHNYSNLWESKNTAYETPAGTLPNHKTVYDPSPRRYCVPTDETFDGFTSYSSASADGVFFPTGVGTNTVFFPAAGFMNYTSASSSKGGDNGYWTYHPGDGTQERASYCFNFTVNTAAGTATLYRKTLKNREDDWMSRAYGLSLRPIAYDESAVVAASDGTSSAIYNFEELWNTGSGPSNMNGYTITTPTTVETAHQNDFSLSFVTERDVNNKKIRYEYDSTNGYGSLILPDSYEGLTLHNYNRFTVSTSNSNIHIVQIILTYAQKGVGITTDSPTFDSDDAVWVDSSATYSTSTQTWTGGKQSVQFTMDSGTGDPWKVVAITVNYYVDPTP